MRNTSSRRFLDRSNPPSMFTLILLASVSALTMTIYLPSLPAIASELNSSTGIIGLSVGIYLASSAAVQLIVGPLSDQVGRRPLIIWSLVLFCISTVAIIFSQSAGQFFVLRVFQAVCATCMVLSRAIVRDTTDSVQAAGSRIAYVTMGMAIVPMFGPAIGGTLDYFFG